MKKNYKTPATIIMAIEIQQMIASTTLDPTSSNPRVEVSSQSYGGTFSSRRGGGSWDDDED